MNRRIVTALAAALLGLAPACDSGSEDPMTSDEGTSGGDETGDPTGTATNVDSSGNATDPTGNDTTDPTGNDTDDPLERLLIERIACNWIEVHLVEQLTNQLRADGQASLDQVEYYQKFLDRTQRRFLSACKTLAQVRKLMGVDTLSRNPTAGTAKRAQHQARIEKRPQERARKATRPQHQANEAGVEQLVLEVEAKSR